jgi:anti-sigma factor RsiW
MAPNPACKTFVPQLSPFLDGELKPDDRVAVERHLAACKDCTMRAADLRAESGLLRVGMEMLADEVDFKDFSQKVMARITPERPPVLERIKISLSEMFTYQRGMMLTSLATAAAVLLVAVPVLLSRESTPLGYAGERMAVETVKIDESAHVAPVVLETEGGDAIVFTIEHDHQGDEPKPPRDGEADEELGIDPTQRGDKKPQGGDL